MKIGEIKAVLALADKQPINCALALASDKSGLMMVHKQTSPKILLKQLELKAKSADKNSIRFGRITVDPADPGTLKFAINKKEVGGTVMGLVKLAKKAGYQAVIMNEDPALEGGDAAASAQAQGTVPPPPPPPPAQAQSKAPPAPPPPPAQAQGKAPPPPPPQGQGPAQPAAGWDELSQALTGLVQQIPTASGGNPMLQQPLVKLAGAAQAALKARKDAAATAAAIGELRRAVADAADQAKLTKQAQAGGGAVTYAKSRLAWLAVRKKVESDIEKLRTTVLATYQEDGIAAALDKAFKARVEPVLSALDERLSDALDDASNATDPKRRAELVAGAKEIMGDYTIFLNTDKTIAELDANPFVPLSIRNTIAATLNTLSKAVQ